MGRNRCMHGRRQWMGLLFSWSFLCSFLLVVIVAGSFPIPASAAEEVKIGIILPLSGGLAKIGTLNKAAYELGADAINAAGGIKSLGGAKIKLVFGDSEGKPTVGVSETERLILQEGVVAISGAWQSAVTLPTTEVAERYKVPYVNTVAGADNILTRGFKYTFQICTKQAQNGTLMAEIFDYATKITGKKPEQAALLYENTDYGQNTAAGGRNYLNSHGYNIVADVSYSNSSPDLTPQLMKVKAANPQGIFQSSYLHDGILIAQTAKKIALDVFRVDGGGVNDPNFLATLGPIAEGQLALNQWNVDLELLGSKELNERFRAKSGLNIDMNGHAAEDYQAMIIFREALEKCSRIDREALRNAIAAIEITGKNLILPHEKIKFDETGFNTYARNIITQIQGGKWVTVYPEGLTSSKPIFPKY